MIKGVISVLMLLMPLPSAGSAAEVITGCIGPSGQLSQLQVGDEPRSGECRGNRELARLQLADEDQSETLTINVSLPAGTNNTVVGEIGPFEIVAGCFDSAPGSPLYVRWTEPSASTRPGLDSQTFRQPGFLHLISTSAGLFAQPTIFGRGFSTTSTESGSLLRADVNVATGIVADCSFLGEFELFRSRPLVAEGAADPPRSRS